MAAALIVVALTGCGAAGGTQLPYDEWEASARAVIAEIVAAPPDEARELAKAERERLDRHARADMCYYAMHGAYYRLLEAWEGGQPTDEHWEHFDSHAIYTRGLCP